MLHTWLRLHTLNAVAARLKQPAAEFSVRDILRDVQNETGERLGAGIEREISEILKTVPGIKEVIGSGGSTWCKTLRSDRSAT